MSAIQKTKDKTSSSLAESLTYLMHQHGIHELKLSKLTKIPQPTLHKILTCKTQDPRISTIQTLASYFNLTVDDLLSGNKIHNDYNSQITMHKVPVLSWNNCYHPHTTSPNHDNFCCVDCSGKHCFALMSKPSMSPLFPAQTFLIIDPDIEPIDGDTILVLYPNTDECTLRELSIDGPTRLIHPILQGTNTHELDETMRIVGVLVQSKLSYK